MHEAVLVRVSERVGRLRRDLDRVVCRKRPMGQAAGQRFAFHQFHDEVIEVAVVAHVVDAADVRVVEARDRLRLAMEPLAPLVAQAVGLDQNLDRDRSIEPAIVAAIDFAHAASAERRDDLVRPEARTGGKDHSGPSVIAAARAAAPSNSRPSGCPAHAAASRSYTSCCLCMGRPEIGAAW